MKVQAKRCIALLLVVVTIFSNISISVAAEETDNQSQEKPASKTYYRYREKTYTTSTEELEDPWILYDQKQETQHGETFYVYLDEDETIDTTEYCVHIQKIQTCKYHHQTNSKIIYVRSSLTDHAYYYSNGSDEPRLYWHYGDCYCYLVCYQSAKTTSTTYHYYKWSDWSEWSETPMTATDDVEVETKTVGLFTITYDANGGNGAPDASTKEADEIVSLSSVIPTRDSHEFLGWATLMDGDVEYAPGDEYSVNADVTLYAIWKNITEYTVAYDANGGTGAPASTTKKHDETIILSTTIPARENHQFLGWSTSQTGVVEYAAGDEYSANAEVTLYAIWKNVTEYTVTYDANGGTGVPTQQIKIYDDTITISSETPEREGYTFLGWSTTSSGEVEYFTGDEYSANSSVLLYAVWRLEITVVASGVCGDELTWVLTEDGTLTICGNGPMYDFGDAPWYDYRESIESIVIDEGATYIGYQAFSECEKVTSIVIPNTVETIGGNAFYCCVSLAAIEIPDSVKEIGTYAFAGCMSLKTIRFGNNLSTIPAYSFWHCDGLTDVVIPDNVTSIGYRAFSNCENLASVDIGNGVTTIDDYAFADCGKLETIKLGNGIKAIGGNAFTGCYSLANVYISDMEAWCNISYESSMDCLSYHAENLYYDGSLVIDLVIPEGTTTISQYAFYDCEHLTSVTIPNSVETIGESAFAYCLELNSVKFGSGIKTISDAAFQSCDNLKSVIYCGTQEQWNIIDIDSSNSDLIDATRVYHSWMNATCTSPKICSLCGATEGNPSHNYGAWKKVDDETHKRTCICGDAETEGHNWDAGKITAQPTHTAYGERTYTCVDCSATKTEQVAKTTDHSYGAWKQVDDETHKRTCICGDAETEGHDWGVGIITTQPTHTTFGERTYTCGDCSATKTEQVAKTTDHSYGAWTKVDDETHKRTCICGDAETEGHDWGVGIITTQPTHTTFGERTYTCGDCSATKTEQVAKTTEHAYSSWTEVDAISHKRTCACGAVETAAHTWDGGQVGAMGIKMYTCADCPGTKTEKIAYTVTFEDWDGTQISSTTCYYGDAVTIPMDPVRASDRTYSYSFAGWDKTVTACKGDATYTATYTASYIDYTVVFKDWDGTVLSSETYHLGDAVTAPEAPTRPANERYYYIFSGWDKKVTVCSGDTVYTAVYGRYDVEYTVTFCMPDGTVIRQDTYYFGDSVVVPEPVAPEGMVFVGWDREVTTVCIGSVTFTAVFEQLRKPGDFDGDGAVTDADVIYLLWHTVFPEDYPLEISGDFDGDDAVTDADVIYLLWHTVFPEDYPLQ